MDPTRERDLVVRSRVDRAAFGELYDFYLPRLFAFIVRRVGERAIAEDLTATVFERALGAIGRADFRNEAFGGWLYRVASNIIVDHVRRDARTVPLAARAGDPWEPDEAGRAGAAGRPDRGRPLGDDAAAAAFTAAIDRDALRRGLLVLPEQHRRLIVLKFLDGLDTDELCATLACSRPTLAVKLHRALRALRAAVVEETTDAA